MKRVYAISSGEYSDYNVHVICPSKKIASAVLARMRSTQGYNPLWVEEIPLAESADDIIIRTVYQVEINKGGEETLRNSCKVIIWDDKDNERLEQAKVWDGKAWAVSYRGYDVALKAARDKLGIKQAEDEGVS